MNGSVAETVAGNYSVTYTLKKGYAWDDDTTDPITINWVINRLVISNPSLNATSFGTTGNYVGPAVYYDSAHCYLSGTTSVNWVGSFAVYVCLNDTNNMIFANGSTDAYGLGWSTYASSITIYTNAASSITAQRFSFTYTSWASMPNVNSAVDSKYFLNGNGGSPRVRNYFYSEGGALQGWYYMNWPLSGAGSYPTNGATYSLGSYSYSKS